MTGKFNVVMAESERVVLRERREDIPLIDMHALQAAAAKARCAVRAIDNGALERLLRYSWPGNVRELFNVIDYAVMLRQEETLRVREFPPEVTKGPPLHAAAGGAWLQDERAELETALKNARGNRSKAAKLLGISRATFYRRMAEHGIS